MRIQSARILEKIAILARCVQMDNFHLYQYPSCTFPRHWTRSMRCLTIQTIKIGKPRYCLNIRYNKVKILSFQIDHLTLVGDWLTVKETILPKVAQSPQYQKTSKKKARYSNNCSLIKAIGAQSNPLQNLMIKTIEISNLHPRRVERVKNCLLRN